jgi:hypothetical protein
MTAPKPPRDPNPDFDDTLLDEALVETFPASDAVQLTQHEKLPPAAPPGSDVHDQ